MYYYKADNVAPTLASYNSSYIIINIVLIYRWRDNRGNIHVSQQTNNTDYTSDTRGPLEVEILLSSFLSSSNHPSCYIGSCSFFVTVATGSSVGRNVGIRLHFPAPPLPRLLPHLPLPSLPLHWAARKSQDGWCRLEVMFPSAKWSRECGRKRGRHHRAFIFIFF